ncbi:MAG TPA: hypothetical protein ENF81_01865 [Thermotogaceae bacterium]|nr:hypothetical protein [Thermotogaceae bacterium]
MKEKNIGEIVVNLTGGTSLLGYMVERIRGKVRYGKTVRTIMAINRRSYDEQRENPYVLGEVLEIPE